MQLIGTAHGNTLENLTLNPTLSDLIGGVQTVTLTDEEARLRGTQKTVSERKAPPTFDAVVELIDRERLIVHVDTAAAVDRLLRGLPPSGQRRGGGQEQEPAPREPHREPARQRRIPLPDERRRQITIYPYAIKKNSTAQIRRVLQSAFHVMGDVDDQDAAEAVRETEDTVREALATREAQALPPRPPAVRELQHKVVVQHQMAAEGEGSGAERHPVIRAPTSGPRGPPATPDPPGHPETEIPYVQR